MFFVYKNSFLYLHIKIEDTDGLVHFLTLFKK